MENSSSNPTKYQVGFALSGGFIKGFAHLGVMQALAERGFRPDIISGVSAGALAGAFIADGHEPYTIVEFFSKQTFNNLTSFARSFSGLLKMDDFINFLREHLSTDRIERLKIPLVITASDLDHGTSVHFTKGDLYKCIAASCCMPILFSPINIDGVNYVDGGIFMNLPVTPIRKQCETVVAVNVSPRSSTNYRKNVLGIGLRCYNYMFSANSLHDRLMADILIETHNLETYDNRRLEKAGEIFEIGYRQGKEQLDRILTSGIISKP